MPAMVARSRVSLTLIEATGSEIPVLIVASDGAAPVPVVMVGAGTAATAAIVAGLTATPVPVLIETAGTVVVPVIVAGEAVSLI